MNKFKYLFAIVLFLASCKTTQRTSVDLPELTVKPDNSAYRASNTIYNNIEHMKLDVSFDWSKRYLFGKQELTVRPHFYPSNNLILDARGMEIKQVALINTDGTKKDMQYTYLNDVLTIDLDKTYKNTETYKIFIDYIAKPDELKSLGGSAAIISDKGLYFINPDGSDKNKPQQLWTQGETQSNSVWFPIIDSPNQRMTQELSITVDPKFETLSNGLMISSVKNADGTRTDTWKQTLPAAPYLTMIAASPYKVVKDKWRNMEVNYYVDSVYEQYARNIFGHTPEMIEFFSNKLGVDYPWEKYSQAVAHDYVSGAMENTTAVIHGEFLQRTARELLDATNESVISHELFHHWFGDLVTCESWSNIPLNESFATYGEYLWNENKYGREEADYEGLNDLNEYLAEAKYKQVDLIRFTYKSREDVYDRHSYAKGGRILHMLRKYVGDDAFFASLKKYLNDNKFKTVEAHQLRLAFEDVTGEDLNWFFNEWFFAKGHPDIEISYAWNDTIKKQVVTIKQRQSFKETPLYKLPLKIDIYEGGKVRRESVTVETDNEVFFFDCDKKPDLVNVDAEKQLVCVKADNHTTDEWIFQYNHASLFLDRYEAVAKIAKGYEGGSSSAAVIIKALNDNHFAIRNLALKNIDAAAKADKESVKAKITDLVRNDIKASVRANALIALHRVFDDESLDSFALNDSSYDVMTTALLYYSEKHPKDIEILKKYEQDKNGDVQAALTDIYSHSGNDDNYGFMVTALQEATGYSKYLVVQNFQSYLALCKPETIQKGSEAMVAFGKTSSKLVKTQTVNSLTLLKKDINTKLKEYGDKAEYFANVSKLRKTTEYIDQSLSELKNKN